MAFFWISSKMTLDNAVFLRLVSSVPMAFTMELSSDTRMTCSLALVTAVYKRFRFRKKLIDRNSGMTTFLNSDPWLLWMVMAVAGSKKNASSFEYRTSGSSG